MSGLQIGLLLLAAASFGFAGGVLFIKMVDK